MEIPSEIKTKPIGYVRNRIKQKMHHRWSHVESLMIIDPSLAELLDGLEDFSHIIVLFWIHKNTGEIPVKVHPQGREELPLTGVFATRAPHRPNSIGMTVVQLLERDRNSLKVIGLDAIDGTPILDIKPYMPKDCVPNARQADWVAKLHHT